MLIIYNCAVGWAERREARHWTSPLAGCFYHASHPALISAGYGIMLIIYNCAVGWAERREARHRMSSRAPIPGLVSPGYSASWKEEDGKTPSDAQGL
ncbi:hypothetical protein Lgee_1450 [Legionella geestiana]|uniref:Uncharacterized protein n=1 Tax=Legionella geestiana TaxID=45065 RepID=A0A0W0TT18_9GAMM|nr:hypothetical protein Lgee_1450 [Legionella geestiana]STX54754.1 Uncharacterised protein [Legionella geestiana]